MALQKKKEEQCALGGKKENGRCGWMWLVPFTHDNDDGSYTQQPGKRAARVLYDYALDSHNTLS